MVFCFALPPSCVLVESIIASVYAIPANRDRIRALGLAIRLSCTIIEHGRTVTVFPKSHRKFLRTVFSNRKFLSVVLHSMISSSRSSHHVQELENKEEVVSGHQERSP